MKKYYTLSEYCSRFSVDLPTRDRMTQLSLLQSRIAGGDGITRSSKLPLEFWRELHSKAERNRSIHSLFCSVPCYIRNTRSMQGIEPRAFYAFMKENYKAFKSKSRRGGACVAHVFLIADLRAGAKQFLNKAEGSAPQKRQDSPSAPEAVNACTVSGNTTQGILHVTVPERGPSMAFSPPESYGLLGFVLGALSGAAVAVACLVCCF